MESVDDVRCVCQASGHLTRADVPASDLEKKFHALWKRHGWRGGRMYREYRFHPARKWRMDFAWPRLKVFVEIDGSRSHGTMGGRRKDNEKQNKATEMGWVVLRYMAGDLGPLRGRDTIEQVNKVLEMRSKQ